MPRSFSDSPRDRCHCRASSCAPSTIQKRMFSRKNVHADRRVAFLLARIAAGLSSERVTPEGPSRGCKTARRLMNFPRFPAGSLNSFAKTIATQANRCASFLPLSWNPRASIRDDFFLNVRINYDSQRETPRNAGSWIQSEETTKEIEEERESGE